MTPESGVFLGIDHGGSTTTALLYDPDVGTLASASVPMPKHAPSPGLVEHDPEDFLRTTLESAGRALESASLGWSDVRSIGIANQGETSMAWSLDGKPYGPALSWEDRRTADYCSVLAGKGVDALVRQRTGIMLDPYFSASKFHWLEHQLAAARTARQRGGLCLGGTDSFVIHRLTAGEAHATDPGTASRTALLNIRAVAWDEDLLAAFDVDRRSLPRIEATCGSYGKVRHTDIPAAGIEICADVVDAHAALFAQGCFDATVAKATYGTGAFTEVNTGRTLIEPDGRLPVFIAWQIDGSTDYTLEGGVFSVGSAIDWAVGTGLFPSASETSRLAASVADTGGVLFVPSFAGISAPHWLSSARALVSGLGLDTTKAHLSRALLDGIALSCSEVVRTLNDRLGHTLTEIRADGGPSRNDYLMQRQADLTGLPVSTSSQPDMTALGAALLAAIGSNQMTVDDVAGLPRDTRRYEPRMQPDQQREIWEDWERTIRFLKELAAR
jgi:glycerol kinase